MVSLLLGVLLVAAPQVETDVVYKTVGDVELAMDIYRPTVASDAEPGPAVVAIHGGAWIGGQREDMAELCQGLAEAGFVAATITYRLGPNHKWPSMIQDAQDAVRFLRANAEEYNIDPDRIGAAGGSAGGHLALLLGATDGWPGDEPGTPSSRVSAVFNLFGPTDMQNDFDPQLVAFLGMQIMPQGADLSEAMVDASPVTYIDAKTAPVYTVHGDADQTVPVEQARRLDRALGAAGVESVLVIIPGMGHEVPMERPEVAQAIVGGVAFLQEKLGAAAPVGR